MVCSRATFTAADVAADVGVLLEGEPSISPAELEELAKDLYEDAKAAVRIAALVAIEGEERDQPPGPLELSVVLCDDAHIQELNREWRGMDAPTDVLSFEMGEFDDEDYPLAELDDEEVDESGVLEEEQQEADLDPAELDDEDGDMAAPLVLGDLVLSIDTAARQAADRGHSLRDECRILIVHGILHLLGYDHEDDEEEQVEMARAEEKILKALNWTGSGLISMSADGGSTLKTASATPSSSQFKPFQRWSSPDIRLLALDMDGTLLDGRSRVLESSVKAIRAAIDRGVRVILATGKARPAAMAAMKRVGLFGDDLVIGPRGPGIFLQGLAVHGVSGDLIAGGEVEPEVVRAAFQFAAASNIAVCGFLGETCVTIRMTAEVAELHERYYEPLAEVAPTLDAVLSKGPLRKLLFMAQPDLVSNELIPRWDLELEGTGAQTMQAVPDMLEIVPRGWNKWVGMQALLDHTGLKASDVMAVGDGSNDLELIRGVGLGIAMGNAAPSVKAVAKAVVSDNDEGGVAEAIERFILL